MDSGWATLSTFIKCYDFFLAPTGSYYLISLDLNGNNPNIELRPHVIINSFGCPHSICGVEALKQSVDSLTKSVIAVVARAG
jgi:hypothetical protein